MEMLKWLDDILNSRDRDEKINNLSNLAFWLEKQAAQPGEILPLLNRLIEHAVQEKDGEVREEMLNAIHYGLGWNDCDRTRVHWDLLLDYIPRCEERELPWLLEILGFSFDRKWVPFIEAYLTHPSSDVRASAMDAIAMIRHNNR